MRDRATELFGGALHVDVDPLMVSGRLSKHVDAILINHMPIGHANFLAGKRFEIIVSNGAWVRHIILLLV